MSTLSRASGILAHPTCLPGTDGIGDLGPGAHAFVEFLAQARQRWWQVLPIGPTGHGNSPYAASSAFAGNPLLVALGPLVEHGLLEPAELGTLRRLPVDRVDFDHLAPTKRGVLRLACERLAQRPGDSLHGRLQAFRDAESAWLDDFALFSALDDDLSVPWTDWPDGLRDRLPADLDEARQRLHLAIETHVFAQFLFFEQWEALRRFARDRGVGFVGDIPIFVAHQSADVWAHRELFKLDAVGRPTVVAGVPPDYFTTLGQLWGNPLYRWDVLEAQAYDWWVQRFRQLLRLVDVVRIDHFRGFQAAWEVPAGAQDAVTGAWVEGPGIRFFEALIPALGRIPIIVEDLGLITDEVRDLVHRTGYPGMKALEFAFSGDPNHPYLPHTYTDTNCVVYTGTHDNDTVRGWYSSASIEEQTLARRYLGSDSAGITWALVREALRSIATTAIIPLQDVLDLGSETRMNVPGQAEGNWRWRVTERQLTPAVAERLGELTWLYGRAG